MMREQKVKWGRRAGNSSKRFGGFELIGSGEPFGGCESFSDCEPIYDSAWAHW